MPSDRPLDLDGIPTKEKGVSGPILVGIKMTQCDAIDSGVYREAYAIILLLLNLWQGAISWHCDSSAPQVERIQLAYMSSESKDEHQDSVTRRS